MFGFRHIERMQGVTALRKSFSLARILAVALLPSVALVDATLAAPFSYQGLLMDGGSPANGIYEIRFRLLNQLEGGTQSGPALLFTNVSVTTGVFTTSLDFGPGVFNGNALWLEMSARTAGSTGSLVVLAPRQPIQAVPYAQHAFSGNGDAAQLTTGFLPDARLSAGIVRTSQLGASSNALSARIDVLTARIDALTSALTGLSNRVGTNVISGLTMVSSDPADPALLGEGLIPFHRVISTGWVGASAVGAPAGRSEAAVVWTGGRLLVWGGDLGAGLLSGLGGEYDPATDSWSPLTPLNAPSERRGSAAVWTGSGLAVWGGRGAAVLGDGAIYSPASAEWTAMGGAGAPSGREDHAAVWTGARMLVWGGRNAFGLLGDGAAYDPVRLTWTALPTAGAPSPRMGASVVWGAGRLMVWGGVGSTGPMGTGASLSVAGGTSPGSWTPMASAAAPSAREGHSAIWTGSRLLVWGGRDGSGALNTGALFDPAANVWTSVPTNAAPSARWDHAAAWTGREMVVIGGRSKSGELSDGAIFDPVRGAWRPIPGAVRGVARAGATAIWTGSEILIFGGEASGQALSALRRLNPEPDWYFYRKP